MNNDLLWTTLGVFASCSSVSIAVYSKDRGTKALFSMLAVGFSLVAILNAIAYFAHKILAAIDALPKH